MQRERLTWLARLAQLGDKWNVRIATGVFGSDYRALLRRSRIVFNRSIRGECNKRAFEAATCGALLLQEAQNSEVRQWFDEGREFVAYTTENLESVLDHFLTHEEKRIAVAAAARTKVREYGFDALWARTLDQIREQWPTLIERARGTSEP